MPRVAVVVICLLATLAVAAPAHAGFDPTVSVRTRPSGVALGVRTPGRPAGDGKIRQAPDGPDGPAPRSVSCQYQPVPSASGGLTFAASCNHPTGTSVPFNPFGNALFITPTPPDPAAPSPSTPAGVRPTVTPGMLATQARRFLPIPLPTIRSNPPASRDQLVNMATWLWLDPASWSQRTATASVPGLSVTVTAMPVSTTWTMGDGGRLVCAGPGRPYEVRHPSADARSDCSYTYLRSSARAPGGRYVVRATTTWRITWVASGSVASAGGLPPLARTATTALRVVEAQTLD